MVMRVGNRLSKIMFCNEKIVNLYLLVSQGPLLQITRSIDLNYSHALKLLKIWESMGLIIRNKAGFRYNIFYTGKGRRLSDNLLRMKIYLRRSKIQW
jgi:predicted transcriptional regulator